MQHVLHVNKNWREFKYSNGRNLIPKKKKKKEHNFGFINPLMVAEKIIMVKEVKTRNL